MHLLQPQLFLWKWTESQKEAHLDGLGVGLRGGCYAPICAFLLFSCHSLHHRLQKLHNLQQGGDRRQVGGSMARTSRDSREVVSRIAENLEMLWRKVCTLKDPGTWVSHLGLSHLAWGSLRDDEHEFHANL